jgi:UDP-N-acetylglucosamine--N-acetylmuramyl-(pentapeptide) pyrophosphoryl-undecaprenol N-acetylglucosamine transferase
MGEVRILMAGGGTGGHVFPAIQIASYLQKKWGATCEFVGTCKGIEYIKVPQAGFMLHTIWISGIHRRLSLENVLFPLKLIISLIQSRRILRAFKPALVIGTGGCVSGPVLYQATRMKIACAIQEQNSYPGITTRLLARRVDMIFLAYKEALHYLKKVKNVFFTGNPVSLSVASGSRNEAYTYFDLNGNSKTILVFGGSQGAVTINRAIDHLLMADVLPDFQLIWQTGIKEFKQYGEKYTRLKKGNVHIYPFIDRMDLAYSVSDFAVCRAGAMTISELAAFKVPAVFVPYPHAAANHQYKNAKSVVQGGGGLLLEDNADLPERMKEVVVDLLRSPDQVARMSENIRQFHAENALAEIAGHLSRIA